MHRDRLLLLLRVSACHHEPAKVLEVVRGLRRNSVILLLESSLALLLLLSQSVERVGVGASLLNRVVLGSIVVVTNFANFTLELRYVTVLFVDNLLQQYCLTLITPCEQLLRLSRVLFEKRAVSIELLHIIFHFSFVLD